MQISGDRVLKMPRDRVLQYCLQDREMQNDRLDRQLQNYLVPRGTGFCNFPVFPALTPIHIQSVSHYTHPNQG